ncbi:hypothetical protein [Nonomuraea sp. LPB2021202275-12-8]|uniref:hypothetical protein n=1 Tax=Nonomuraea sp. LPB2021202275-12-8 TaxID=3120159 RepID=UPI00300D1DAF
MATWGTSRGSAAFTAVAGLLLLALVIVASAPTWAGGGVQRSSATDVMTPGSEVSAMSTMPQQPFRGPEQLHRLSLPRHRSEVAPVRPALAWPEGGSAAIRGPQQPGHRAAGSRSPPLA